LPDSLLPPRDTEAHLTLLAGIRRDHSTPPKFQLPTAFSPPLLAPRPDLVQLSALLRRNCFNLEPALAGDARAPPRRRQPPSARPPAHLGTQIVPLQPTGARARLTCSCSPVPRRERRYPDMAAAIPRRRPCSAAAHRVHPLPSSTPGPVGRAQLVHPRR
jgi:hypothetical protein